MSKGILSKFNGLHMDNRDRSYGCNSRREYEETLKAIAKSGNTPPRWLRRSIAKLERLKANRGRK
jgi:hypothetical protein